MKKLFFYWFCAVSGLFFIPCGAGDNPDAESFLRQARQKPGEQRTWAAMNGQVMHLRKDEDASSSPLYLGILFTPERTLAQIVIDNRQGYSVGQVYSEGVNGTSIVPLHKAGYKDPLLARFGLRPEDLTMTFLYWKFLKELDGEVIKLADCRVFLLQSPDGRETVKLFISRTYFSPLKVEWFKDAVAAEKGIPYRTLEVSSFKRENDLSIPTGLSLYGPGWRSKVKFDRVAAGMTQAGIPKDLFKSLAP